MTFEKMQKICLEVKDLYDQHNVKVGEAKWTVNDYLDGMMGDIGDLHKLIMAQNNKRAFKAENYKGMTLDDAIAHEICDVFWSVVVLADQCKVDLENSVLKNMQQLKALIQK